MLVLKDQPRLADIQELAEKVPAYPISVGQLIDLAIAENAHHSLIDFYGMFNDDYFFPDKEDLITRSQQVEMLNIEAGDMPTEELTTPEED